MIIKNLTPKLQPLKVEEFVGGRDYIVYVEGYGVADIEGLFISNPEKYKGIFDLGDIKESEITEEFTPVDESIEENPPVVEEESNEKEESSPEVLSDKFICDVCGAEFGSARGLASHKNRVHPE